ncbi:protein eyes shut-like [Zerene cesonia]|uniref:protein eyes shut-like n=1 Tax=Zerene cesonia TaxID=33412 RepID=UPI0018E573F7|nr:protein eyes shut-like [Zerene cesonia]
MNQLIKVIVFFLVVYQSHEVNSKKYFKILTIEKEPGHEHEVLLYHYKPISFIKETITPFGTFSYRHSVEKRDLHKRRTREIEDLIEIPNVAIKEELKPILDEKVAFTSIPTDIILTRMEFYKGKPLKLHTISTPTSLEHELHNDETEDTNEKAIPEPVPLSTPEHSSDISDKSNEVIGDQNGVATNIDLNTEVEKMSSTTEVKSDSENLKLTEDNHEKEVSLDEKTASGTEINTSSGDTKVDDKESSQIEETSPEAEIKSDSEEIKVPESNHEKETSPETNGKPDDAKLSEEHHEVEKETTEQKSLNEHSESGVIENRDVETEATQDINKNVELVAPLNSDDLSSKSTIEVAQTVKPVETPSFPVSPLPVPVYIPFYTEIRNPQPIEPVVNIPPEIPAEIHEVVSVVPPVVVITEKKVILPPPPPPPVQTVETVIETEQRPSLFSRGSRFMLNISSRILKKLLRFVSSARSRLHLGPAEE